MWLNLAVANSDDKKTAQDAAKMRDKIAAKMTPAQIAKAQELAAKWKPKNKPKANTKNTQIPSQFGNMAPFISNTQPAAQHKTAP